MKPPPKHTGENQLAEALRTTLGHTLKVLREERGITLLEAAHWIDTDASAMRNLELQSKLPSMERLCLLAELYGVEVSEILKRAEDAAQPF